MAILGSFQLHFSRIILYTNSSAQTTEHFCTKQKGEIDQFNVFAADSGGDLCGPVCCVCKLCYI